MKKINLLTFVFLFLLSASVYAGDRHYVPGNSFEIPLPESWIITTYDSPPYLQAVPPNAGNLLMISCLPITKTPDFQEATNNVINAFQKQNYDLESVEKIYIDNREARKIVFSSSLEKYKYLQFYFTYGNSTYYTILIDGYYKNLEADNKIFSNIVNQMKILK